MKRDKGFTLIELFIVICSIIMSFVMTAFGHFHNGGERSYKINHEQVIDKD